MCEERNFDYKVKTDTSILMEMRKNRYKKNKIFHFQKYT